MQNGVWDNLEWGLGIGDQEESEHVEIGRVDTERDVLTEDGPSLASPIPKLCFPDGFLWIHLEFPEDVDWGILVIIPIDILGEPLQRRHHVLVPVHLLGRVGRDEWRLLLPFKLLFRQSGKVIRLRLSIRVIRIKEGIRIKVLEREREREREINWG